MFYEISQNRQATNSSQVKVLHSYLVYVCYHMLKIQRSVREFNRVWKD
jgi:hypothetical protein